MSINLTMLGGMLTQAVNAQSDRIEPPYTKYVFDSNNNITEV